MSSRSSRTVRSGLAQPVGYLVLMVLGLVVGLTVGFSPASASIGWRGDYESGSFSQWNYGVQEKVSGRAQVVTSPLRQGGYAGSYTVQPGDNDVAGSGTWERCEALIDQATSDGVEGHEDWYAWSMLTPPAGQPLDVYQATQFHPTGSGGSGQTGFSIDTSGLSLHVFGEPGSGSNGTKWFDQRIASYQAGHWYDIVFHVLWSKDPSRGFFEAFVDGKQVVPLTHAATLFAVDDGVYMKQGIYTAPQSYPMTLVYDGTRRGSSYQDVIADFPAGEWPGVAAS
jgi:hypothetical protein